MFRRLYFLLKAILQRNSLETRMDGEMKFHLDAYIDELVESGISVEEARRRARLEFGSPERWKEECREARRLNLVDTLSRDLRHALRMSARNLSFTLTIVVTMALGIGSATAIFSVVYGVLLKPLPFPHPERLVEISTRPRRTTVTVSKPRCGCDGKPGTTSPWYMRQPSLPAKSWPMSRPANEAVGPSWSLPLG